MNPVEYVGMAGGALGLTIAIPQFLRIRATGHTNGVSFFTWGMFYIVYAAWLAYGIRYHAPSQIFTNLLAFTFCTPLVYRLFADRAPNINRSVRIVTMTAAAAFAFTFMTFMPVFVIYTVLTGLCLVRLPQVITSWKNRHNPEPTNVSFTSWTLGIVASLIWITYAILLGTQPVLYVTNSINLAFSIAVIAFELARRKAARPRH